MTANYINEKYKSVVFSYLRFNSEYYSSLEEIEKAREEAATILTKKIIYNDNQLNNILTLNCNQYIKNLINLLED